MAIIRTYGSWVFVLVSVLFYFLFARDIQRTNHAELLLGFGVLVALWLLLHRFLSNSSWVLIFSVGIVFRLVFFLSAPHLSDDYFRFVWDGELSKDGYSAFEFIPSKFDHHVKEEHQEKYASMLEENSEEFPSGMNSKNYYSIYPTVNQFVFQTAAFDNDPYGFNLMTLRNWILLAEIISFFLLKSLLTAKNKSNWLSLYWLHPLVIIELTGNIHLEALAITFILLALFFAQKNKWVGAGIAVALGVMTKLTPLLLLGAFYRKLPFWRWILLCAATGFLSIALFAIYVDLETFLHFKESVGLFFAWFSFNSGLYYSVRDIALLFSGVDISSLICLVFPFISAAIMLRITFLGKADMVTTALLLFTTYFLFTPILHPWYITILIPLALLSRKIYPLVWSVLIFGTYIAYGAEFNEPFWWIYLEFSVVIFLMFSELRSTPNWVQKQADRIYV